MSLAKGPLILALSLYSFSVFGLAREDTPEYIPPGSILELKGSHKLFRNSEGFVFSVEGIEDLSAVPGYAGKFMQSASLPSSVIFPLCLLQIKTDQEVTLQEGTRFVVLGAFKEARGLDLPLAPVGMKVPEGSEDKVKSRYHLRCGYISNTALPKAPEIFSESNEVLNFGDLEDLLSKHFRFYIQRPQDFVTGNVVSSVPATDNPDLPINSRKDDLTATHDLIWSESSETVVKPFRKAADGSRLVVDTHDLYSQLKIELEVVLPQIQNSGFNDAALSSILRLILNKDFLKDDERDKLYRDIINYIQGKKNDFRIQRPGAYATNFSEAWAPWAMQKMFGLESRVLAAEQRLNADVSSLNEQDNIFLNVLAEYTEEILGGESNVLILMDNRALAQNMEEIVKALLSEFNAPIAVPVNGAAKRRNSYLTTLRPRIASIRRLTNLIVTRLRDPAVPRTERDLQLMKGIAAGLAANGWIDGFNGENWFFGAKYKVIDNLAGDNHVENQATFSAMRKDLNAIGISLMKYFRILNGPQVVPRG